jgi:Cof subfamily protein (haloacid dehalogenase superfamily)
MAGSLFTPLTQNPQLASGKITIVNAIRLLAIDIDGTLLDPTFQVSAADLSAVRRAHELGIEVALVTGRRHTFALPIADLLGFPVVMMSSNGAVTRTSDGELFHRDLLPAGVARRLIRHMHEFRGNAILTFDKETKGALVVEKMEELTISIRRWLEKNSQFIEHVVPLEDALVEDPIQAMYCGTLPRMQVAYAHLSAGDFGHEITVLRTQYDHRDLSMIDIVRRTSSKGHAVRRWAEHRGYSRDQVMAIGDNYNDVEMLEFAGIPFIMGNACDELKSNGWAVTLRNDQSGVAAALAQVGI